jgi:AbrB family looped-hinge helix DNA binding protein
MTLEATLTSKGQVTLPKALRAALGLEAGTKISFTRLSDGAVMMRVKHRKPADVAGMLTRPGQPRLGVKELSR